MNDLPVVEPWLTFYQDVETLENFCLEELTHHSHHPDASRSPVSPLLVTLGPQLLAQIHRNFQQILVQSGSFTVPHSLQRYLTESHRQLRLLSTDLSLYQAAKTHALQQQRLGILRDRIAKLVQYGQAIAQILQESDS